MAMRVTGAFMTVGQKLQSGMGGGGGSMWRKLPNDKSNGYKLPPLVMLVLNACKTRCRRSTGI